MLPVQIKIANNMVNQMMEILWGMALTKQKAGEFANIFAEHATLFFRIEQIQRFMTYGLTKKQ